MGNFIHILLVISIIVVLGRIIQGKTILTGSILVTKGEKEP